MRNDIPVLRKRSPLANLYFSAGLFQYDAHLFTKIAENLSSL